MTLQKYLDSKYTKAEQLALRELDCSYYNITSLEGTENLGCLTSLICGNNRITSLRGIEHLINLEYLDCSNNKLTSLRGIEKLPKLLRLGCIRNNLPYKSLSYEDIINDILKEIKIENRKNTISNLLNNV